MVVMSRRTILHKHNVNRTQPERHQRLFGTYVRLDLGALRTRPAIRSGRKRRCWGTSTGDLFVYGVVSFLRFFGA